MAATKFSGRSSTSPIRQHNHGNTRPCSQTTFPLIFAEQKMSESTVVQLSLSNYCNCVSHAASLRGSNHGTNGKRAHRAEVACVEFAIVSSSDVGTFIVGVLGIICPLLSLDSYNFAFRLLNAFGLSFGGGAYYYVGQVRNERIP
jgi:hypothetical protein